MPSKRKIIAILLTLVGLLMATQMALAQTNGYEINWFGVGGGANDLTSGDYVLSGDVGQPGAEAVTSGDYALNGWFEGGGASPSNNNLYLPLIQR